MTLQQQALPANRRGTPPPKEHRRAGEVAGGATAECAAVFCCVPCAVMDLVVLAAYKVPAGLLKKAMGKKNRRRLQKKKRRGDVLLRQQQVHVQLQAQQQNRQNGVVAEGKKVGPTLLEEHLAKDAAKKSESVELEEEMWAQFNGTGFWRSTSQRLNQLPQPQTSGETDRL